MELINRAVKEEIIPASMKENIGLYLAFRHYFTHAYALDLYADRLVPLIESIHDVYSCFKAIVSD